jgi:hypothetical protein
MLRDVGLIATPFVATGAPVRVSAQPVSCGPPPPPPSPPPACPNEFTRSAFDDVLDRHVDDELARGVLKLAVDVVVPQLRAPACQWAALVALGVWGLS